MEAVLRDLISVRCHKVDPIERALEFKNERDPAALLDLLDSFGFGDSDVSRRQSGLEPIGCECFYLWIPGCGQENPLPADDARESSLMGTRKSPGWLEHSFVTNLEGAALRRHDA